MLIEIVQERREEEARDDLAQAAFIAWQVAQHQYSAMFRHVGFSVGKDGKNAFAENQRKFWEEFPSFQEYLRDTGIIEDD